MDDDGLKSECCLEKDKKVRRVEMELFYKELTDLFSFLERYKKETDIDLSIYPSAIQDDDRNFDVKSPIVSYDPLTITHVILLLSTSHLSICVYTLIG